MILVLAAFFAEADDLGRAGLAGDVESGQLDSGGSARFVYDRPHRLDHQIALIDREAEIFGLATFESVCRPCRPIIGTASDRYQRRQSACTSFKRCGTYIFPFMPIAECARNRAIGVNTSSPWPNDE